MSSHTLHFAQFPKKKAPDCLPEVDDTIRYRKSSEAPPHTEAFCQLCQGPRNLLTLFRRCKDLREALVLLVVIEGTAEQSPAAISLDRFKQATGLHQTTIYAALHELRMKGLIRRPSPGRYAFASEETRP